MYISMDHERLVFLHKHPDYRVVSDLDFIANRSQHTSLFPLSMRSGLDHLTLAELVKLHRNTTNQDAPTQDSETLQELILQHADELPESDCDPVEVNKQAGYFEDKFPEGMAGFCYVRGANTPGQQRTLEQHYLQSIRDTVVMVPGVRQAVARRSVARQSAPAREPIPARTNDPAAPRAAPNARQAVRPRSGVCGLMHQRLDELYVEHKLVPDKKWFVKELAPSQGWNASTASVQYAAWLKQNNLA